MERSLELRVMVLLEAVDSSRPEICNARLFYFVSIETFLVRRVWLTDPPWFLTPKRFLEAETTRRHVRGNPKLKQKTFDLLSQYPDPRCEGKVFHAEKMMSKSHCYHKVN